VSTARAALRWRAALACAALAAAAAARGESLYVIEQLVVNVSSAPDADGERIATVRSGDRVEVLERTGQQIHVRLASGRDGWIRAGYLSADEPSRTRLAQRDLEVVQLRAQLRDLEQELGAARRAAASTGGAPLRAAAAASGDAEATAAPPAALFGLRAAERPRRVWPWALSSALLALGVGFVLGILTLDRRIRRKYGGLRIY